VDISLGDKLRESAQINRRSPSRDSLGTNLRRCGDRPIMDSEVQLEFHRQMKVMRRGNEIYPNKSRKQEERRRLPRFITVPLQRRDTKRSTVCIASHWSSKGDGMIRKLSSGEYRLYSRKKDKSGKRKNLGTFKSRAAAEKHERAVQYFKRAG
jgi:hypothetical protein